MNLGPPIDVDRFACRQTRPIQTIPRERTAVQGTQIRRFALDL